MLDLYNHEIPCPDDRAMRKFLWYNAFHDGTILSAASPERHGDDLILRVAHGVLQGIARTGTYLMRFHGVTHVECGGNPFCNSSSVYDTLFLDSALLHAEERESQRRLYHLRISTWSGFIDVVFARFSIRLEGGRVDYRLPEINDEVLAANRARYIRRDFSYAQQEIAAGQANDYDLDKYHAAGLWIVHSEGTSAVTLCRARQTLQEPLNRFLARTYAAYLLGLYGGEEDIPQLTQLLLRIPAYECYGRRIVLDAMERIHERTKEAACD